MKVYLAGGFRSGWQGVVRSRLPQVHFLDPSEHHIKDPDEYTRRDLQAVSECDVVLANMEAANPGGYSLALEVGYAHALRKYVVLVEEHPDAQRARYFAMIRSVANIVLPSLDVAIEHLRQLCDDRV